MKNFKIIETEIPDLVIIDPFVLRIIEGIILKLMRKIFLKK